MLLCVHIYLRSSDLPLFQAAILSCQKHLSAAHAILEVVIAGYLVVRISPSLSPYRLRHLRTHSAIKKDEVKSKAVYGHLACQPLSADNHGYRLQPPLEFQKPSKPVAGIYR